MSKGNVFETEMLDHVLNNADIALIGDAAGLLQSAADGNLYVSLHTADPGEAGTQETSEAAYTSYARVAIVRTGAAWTVASGAAENAAAITFPAATGGSESETYFAVGTASSGAGKILYSGILDSALAVSNGITPQFGAGALDITEG